MPDTPSIRSLAAGLNLSRATVSEALRGSPRVKEETRRRVVEEAGRMGYRLDPVASELMAQMRRSCSRTFRGLIALVSADDEARLSPSARRRRAILRESAGRCANELGFKIDPLAQAAENWARLPGVLHARGVVGVLLLPSASCRPEHRALLSTAGCPTVYVDEPEEGAEHVDAVAPDYRQALGLARGRLARRGQARPGLLLHGDGDPLMNHRWLSAYETLRHSAFSRSDLPAPLVLESRLVPAAALERWRREEEVDALLVADQPPHDGGLPVYALDTSGGGGASATGLDLRWADVAARAVDVLSRGHFDRQRGQRNLPALVSLPAIWREEEAGASRADLAPRREEDPQLAGVF